MAIGLGAGTTARWAIRGVAKRLAAGRLRDVRVVPCAPEVGAEAGALGIPLTTLECDPVLALTIDGADEVDPRLDLIKGHGGALLREKIVAEASAREIIIVTEEKLSPVLGTRSPLPVEVVAFGWMRQATFLEGLGARVRLRGGEATPYVTAQGNRILDCEFGPIADPAALASRLSRRAGIVAHGLFLGLATDVIVAGPGGVRELRRER
jgi:ribose 5-phosphate isomerase A